MKNALELFRCEDGEEVVSTEILPSHHAAPEEVLVRTTKRVLVLKIKAKETEQEG